MPVQTLRSGSLEEVCYTVADPAELDGALLALRELPALQCVRVTAVNFSIAAHQVRGDACGSQSTSGEA